MRTVAKRVEKSAWHFLPEMAQQQQCQHVNLAELKAQFVKKIGPEKTSKYLEQIEKLLSGNLVKIKFDELCYMTIGKENIRLHNHLINSIYRNAKHSQDAAFNKNLSRGLINGVARKATTNSALHENGDYLCSSIGDGHAAFGGSHRKIRSDRRTRYSLSVNSPRPDDSAAPRQGVVVKSDSVLENGDLKSSGLSRPLTLCSARVGTPHLRAAEFNPNSKRQRPEAEANTSVKRQRLEVVKSSSVQVPTDDKVTIEGADVAIEKVETVGELNEQGFAVWVDRPVTAPLGIPFCPGSIGSARKPTHTRLNHDSTYCVDSQQLPDTETLHRMMERAAKAEDLQTMNLDSAIISNHGVDALLKRLIKSAIDLKKRALAKRSQEPYSQIPGQSTQGLNISRAVHPLHMDTASIGKDAIQTERFDQSSVSLLDFKTAMELNPQQLGEDWPSKLEKIAFYLLNRE